MSKKEKCSGQPKLYDEDGNQLYSHPVRHDDRPYEVKKTHEVLNANATDVEYGISTNRADAVDTDMSVENDVTENRQSPGGTRSPQPPQTNTCPGAFPIGGIGSTIAEPEECSTGTLSLQPVTAEIVEYDLEDRRELEAQLRRVLHERENAAVAQVVVQDPRIYSQDVTSDSSSGWWSKRRNRMTSQRGDPCYCRSCCWSCNSTIGER